MVVTKGKGKQGRINAHVQKPMHKTQSGAPTGRLFPQKSAKGQQKGSSKSHTVRKGKGKQSKGKGKKGKSSDTNKPERRMDPSDNKGPFSFNSFIKFHGQDLGERLWEQAGALLSVDQAVSDGQIDELDLGLDNLASDNDEDMGVPPPMKTAQKGKGKAKSAIQANNPFNAFNEKETKKGKGKQTLTLKRNNHTQQKGKKGKGKNDTREKRMDPSDGNGPYTYDSFIKYHGEELGQKYWNQAQTA